MTRIPTSAREEARDEEEEEDLDVLDIVANTMEEGDEQETGSTII